MYKKRDVYFFFLVDKGHRPFLRDLPPLISPTQFQFKFLFTGNASFIGGGNRNAEVLACVFLSSLPCPPHLICRRKDMIVKIEVLINSQFAEEYYIFPKDNVISWSLKKQFAVLRLMRSI